VEYGVVVKNRQQGGNNFSFADQSRNDLLPSNRKVVVDRSIAWIASLAAYVHVCEKLTSLSVTVIVYFGVYLCSVCNSVHIVYELLGVMNK